MIELMRRLLVCVVALLAGSVFALSASFAFGLSFELPVLSSLLAMPMRSADASAA